MIRQATLHGAASGAFNELELGGGMIFDDQEFHIWSLLANRYPGEIHGYAILRNLTKERGLQVSRKKVYDTLASLEVGGMTTKRLGDPGDRYAGQQRNYFRLTEKGCEVFDARCDQVEKLIASLSYSMSKGLEGIRGKRHVG